MTSQVPRPAIDVTFSRVEAGWRNLIEQQSLSRSWPVATVVSSLAPPPYPLDFGEKFGLAPPGSQLSGTTGANIPSIWVTDPYGDPHPTPSSGGRTTRSRNQTSSLNEPSAAEPPASDSPAAPPYYRSDDPVLIFTKNAIREQFDDDPSIAVVAGDEGSTGLCYEMVITLKGFTQWSNVSGRIRVPKREFTEKMSVESCQAVVSRFTDGEKGVPGLSRVYTFQELVPMLAIRLVTMHKRQEPLKGLFTMATVDLRNNPEVAADLLKKTLEPYVKQTLEDMTIHRLQNFHRDLRRG
jgi:hypothetical protein